MMSDRHGVPCSFRLETTIDSPWSICSFRDRHPVPSLADRLRGVRLRGGSVACIGALRGWRAGQATLGWLPRHSWPSGGRTTAALRSTPRPGSGSASGRRLRKAASARPSAARRGQGSALGLGSRAETRPPRRTGPSWGRSPAPSRRAPGARGPGGTAGGARGGAPRGPRRPGGASRAGEPRCRRGLAPRPWPRGRPGRPDTGSPRGTCRRRSRAAEERRRDRPGGPGRRR